MTVTMTKNKIQIQSFILFIRLKWIFSPCPPSSHSPERNWWISHENAGAQIYRILLQKEVHPIFGFFFSKLFLLLLLFKTILDGHAFLKPRSSFLHFSTPVCCKASGIDIQTNVPLIFSTIKQHCRAVLWLVDRLEKSLKSSHFSQRQRNENCTQSRSSWLNVSIQLFEDLFCYTKNAECINSVKRLLVCKFSEYNFKLYNY